MRLLLSKLYLHYFLVGGKRTAHSIVFLLALVGMITIETPENLVLLIFTLHSIIFVLLSTTAVNKTTKHNLHGARLPLKFDFVEQSTYFLDFDLGVLLAIHSNQVLIQTHHMAQLFGRHLI